MRSLLAPSVYNSPEVFAHEQERIFRRLWIFAGPRTLLTEPDSFITRTIGGVPIVIQNFAGELKAFVNRCAHRQSAIPGPTYRSLAICSLRRLATPNSGRRLSNRSPRKVPISSPSGRMPLSERAAASADPPMASTARFLPTSRWGTMLTSVQNR